MVTLRHVEPENVWDILNERGEVLRSHLEPAAATAEYERMTRTAARRVLGLVNGQPIHYAGLDRSAIAGQVSFHYEGRAGKEKRVLVMAKERSPSAGDMHALDDAVRQAGAEMGAIVSAERSNTDVEVEASRAGVYESPLCGETFLRIQLLLPACSRAMDSAAPACARTSRARPRPAQGRLSRSASEIGGQN
jgi:hypothetical protein